jgi:hypothetical protein
VAKGCSPQLKVEQSLKAIRHNVRLERFFDVFELR